MINRKESIVVYKCVRKNCGKEFLDERDKCPICGAEVKRITKRKGGIIVK